MFTLFLKYLPTLLVTAVFAWRFQRRLRRNIGRQPLQPKRTVIRISFFAGISLLIFVFALPDTRALIGFLSGIVLGIPLAFFSIRLTTFETTPEGRFYTPNTYIGVGLSILLVARIAYRVTILSTATTTSDHARFGGMQTAITLLLFGLLASYYSAYYTGILLRRRDSKSTP